MQFAISNPLGEDFSIMRTVPLNGMMTSLATNYNREIKQLALYETRQYLSAEAVTAHRTSG